MKITDPAWALRERVKAMMAKYGFPNKPPEEITAMTETIRDELEKALTERARDGKDDE